MPRLLSAVILSLLFLVLLSNRHLRPFKPSLALPSTVTQIAVTWTPADLPGIELNPRFTLSVTLGSVDLAFQIFANGTMHGTMRSTTVMPT